MKNKLIALGAFSALFMVTSQSASAQDLYYRADIGASFALDASIKDKVNNPATSFSNLCDGAGGCGLEVNEIGSSVALSAGIGTRIDKNLRADITISYRPGFELDDSIVSALAGSDTHRADIKNLSIMLSGYYDMPGKNMPYLMAGIGLSRNDIGTTTVTNPLGGPLTRTHSGKTDTGFAWQIGAGMTFEMQNKQVMDISYKFVDAGSIDSGATTVSGNAGGPFGPIAFSGVKGDVRFHEITIGLRF